ncbi:hypothetical protein [Geodermatophilus aquaeductus]|uniref:hypothetical protein n=1 Tax=Geodermatophilus aquaeductus TaxID=1564161 RepID=UPI001159C5CC|nr:hypothetical protein [Geodermatophilus aquaeductus]
MSDAVDIYGRLSPYIPLEGATSSPPPPVLTDAEIESLWSAIAGARRTLFEIQLIAGEDARDLAAPIILALYEGFDYIVRPYCGAHPDNVQSYCVEPALPPDLEVPPRGLNNFNNIARAINEFSDVARRELGAN